MKRGPIIPIYKMKTIPADTVQSPAPTAPMVDSLIAPLVQWRVVIRFHFLSAVAKSNLPSRHSRGIPLQKCSPSGQVTSVYRNC